MRLILECDPRIAYPASAQVIPLASRNRRIRAPSNIRTTAGPASEVLISSTGPPAVPPAFMSLLGNCQYDTEAFSLARIAHFVRPAHAGAPCGHRDRRRKC